MVFKSRWIHPVVFWNEKREAFFQDSCIRDTKYWVLKGELNKWNSYLFFFVWMQNFQLQLEMFVRCTMDVENASEHAKVPVNCKWMPVKWSTLSWWHGAYENSCWEAPMTSVHTVLAFIGSTLSCHFVRQDMDTPFHQKCIIVYLQFPSKNLKGLERLLCNQKPFKLSKSVFACKMTPSLFIVFFNEAYYFHVQG